jgi:hypothetical protein
MTDIAGLCARLRAALEGVTPGTWYATDPDDNPSAIKADQGHCSVYVADAMEPNDQAFIALSREAVPVLLDTRERQAAEIERLRELLRCIRDTPASEFDAVDVANRIRAALTGEDA